MLASSPHNKIIKCSLNYPNCLKLKENFAMQGCKRWIIRWEFADATMVVVSNWLKNFHATRSFTFHSILLVAAIKTKEIAFPWLRARRDYWTCMNWCTFTWFKICLADGTCKQVWRCSPTSWIITQPVQCSTSNYHSFIVAFHLTDESTFGSSSSNTNE